ncbi:FAR1 DNA-binding domain [Sesbania bispinosa]|nr:FAR1 DNA-binding domain [Sesbania bispinosa]
MKFTSIEDVKNHYRRYGKNKGFRFCMGCITKSRTNGMMIGQEFICSKEGFRKNGEKVNGNFSTHDETRVGCKAMLYIKKNEDG